MIVCCVNAGNYQGRGKEYVENLHRMVRENSTAGLDFWCFTDYNQAYAEGISKKPFKHEFLKGWWQKVALFEKDVFPEGERIVFFDLDTLIIGNIDDLLGYTGFFSMLAPFRKGQMKQSGVMAWKHGTVCQIWDMFKMLRFPMTGNGDQEWIGNQISTANLFQSLFPDMFVSYKINKKQFPDKASIVLFHKNPKPHECKDWVMDYYHQNVV